MLLISLLCNSQRLLGDPVTKQICVFPRKGNDPRATIWCTCTWSCLLQSNCAYLNIFFCAIVVFNFHLCLFCQRRGNGPTATIALPAHDHLLLESYFAHFNILCSFTSVFMFSLYSYFVKEEGVTAQLYMIL